MDDAAKAGLAAAKSNGNDAVEFGGGIVQLSDESFLFTQPVTTNDSYKVDAELHIKEGESLVGLYHTHPKGSRSEVFSSTDVDVARDNGFVSYIGVHDEKSIRRFDPSSMKTKFRGRGVSRKEYTKGEVLCKDCF